MPKTVALAHFNQKLANELSTHGFQVVDSRSGQVPDAYLYTSYRPDTDDFGAIRHDHADISIGNYHYTTTDHPATVLLNITGLSLSQIIDRLHSQLARCPRP